MPFVEAKSLKQKAKSLCVYVKHQAGNAEVGLFK